MLNFIKAVLDNVFGHFWSQVMRHELKYKVDGFDVQVIEFF